MQTITIKLILHYQQAELCVAPEIVRVYTSLSDEISDAIHTKSTESVPTRTNLLGLTNPGEHPLAGGYDVSHQQPTWVALRRDLTIAANMDVR